MNAPEYIYIRFNPNGSVCSTHAFSDAKEFPDLTKHSVLFTRSDQLAAITAERDEAKALAEKYRLSMERRWQEMEHQATRANNLHLDNAALKEQVEVLREALNETLNAWHYEAHQGDGIMEEHSAIYDRAQAALAAQPAGEKSHDRQMLEELVAVVRLTPMDRLPNCVEPVLREAMFYLDDEPVAFKPATPSAEKVDQITFYEGKHYYLSNFSSFGLYYDGRYWPTSEHAYQAMKFDQHSLQEQVRDCTSAHNAMKFARSMKESYRPNWDEQKVSYMLDICRAKMQQHEYIRRKLLSTGDATLIESSPIDCFWGWGPNKNGRNELGKVWMTLRDELRMSGELMPTTQPAEEWERITPAMFRANEGVYDYKYEAPEQYYRRRKG